jgi:glyoxylase-like metal-dependent hydrolase (beta-lactamase superfamily II)
LSLSFLPLCAFNTGDVATVWPTTATADQIKKRSVARVEIFKMPGGTEYIVHDVDENNVIVGKARVSGHLKVSESMSVDGFGGHSMLDDILKESKGKAPLTHDSESSHGEDLYGNVPPPTFHPPSFGVTVLGNSHGFDKSGSVSGYVLWINGRGVMIDPPPYSSATLEREGIRPRTIVGIILTHCHADHDAGAFQKVLTGSPVVVITTPTIYKSFIRKYAALSALSPALLRHSHRFKPALIGEPLRFQGATFHFTYTLHTIPCVGFRVEWRGRSMVFTGDHFNSPPDMEKLEASGVLSKARADDLRNLPLQDCDLLLHEAGAPPIHTPLDVLLKLPEKVKKRLYVVHTSALPPDCELKAAPTGTQGTIRLDKPAFGESSHSMRHIGLHQSDRFDNSNNSLNNSIQDIEYESQWSFRNEYDSPSVDAAKRSHLNAQSSFVVQDMSGIRQTKSRTSFFNHASSSEAPPLVALRPPSSTDAWFILNLLSAVPFLSRYVLRIYLLCSRWWHLLISHNFCSLSYTSTMELLETARVNAYRKSDVIVPASRRSQILCVVWEGTCSESLSNTKRKSVTSLPTVRESNTIVVPQRPAVWHAGDWTGPLSLQPDLLLSGESPTSVTHDVVAVSSEGVKVITVEFAGLHSILKSGSSLYRKYLERKMYQERAKLDISSSEQQNSTMLDDALKDLNVLELLNSNSALRKLNAVQKRHLESLAEGPISFQPGERLWSTGGVVDRAFVIVSGSASFVPKRRNAGSASASTEDDRLHSEFNPGANMQIDAKKVARDLGRLSVASSDADASFVLEAEQQKVPAMSLDTIFNKSGLSSDSHNPVEKLRQGLERRANHVNNDGTVHSVDLSYGESQDHDSMDTDNDSHIEFLDDTDVGSRCRTTRSSIYRRRSSHARKANKVLGRLYNRRAFTGGLVFSRGHFLGDVSKMVAGLLASDLDGDITEEAARYSFGEQVEGTDDTVLAELIIPEDGPEQVTHSSTLTAGKDGCIVLVFPKASIIPFLDQYPGVLLSLLGTQVVV